MSVYFVNEKNAKSVPVYEAVINEDQLKELDALVQELRNEGTPNPKLEKAIQLVRKLPVLDPKGVSAPWNMKEICNTQSDIYATVVPGCFSAVLRSNDFKVPNTHVATVLAMPGLPAALTCLANFATVNATSVRKMQKMFSSLKDGGWKKEQYSPLETFAQTESYALFTRLSDGKEGYVGKNGELGPLSKAQTYDNENDLMNALQRQTVFKNWGPFQVVRLNMQVVGMGNRVQSPHFKGGNAWYGTVDLTGATIYEVEALVQRRAIEEALGKASREQLDAAYQNLEDATPPKRKL